MFPIRLRRREEESGGVDSGSDQAAAGVAAASMGKRGVETYDSNPGLTGHLVRAR